MIILFKILVDNILIINYCFQQLSQSNQVLSKYKLYVKLPCHIIMSNKLLKVHHEFQAKHQNYPGS